MALSSYPPVESLLVASGAQCRRGRCGTTSGCIGGTHVNPPFTHFTTFLPRSLIVLPDSTPWGSSGERHQPSPSNLWVFGLTGQFIPCYPMLSQGSDGPSDRLPG